MKQIGLWSKFIALGGMLLFFLVMMPSVSAGCVIDHGECPTSSSTYCECNAGPGEQCENIYAGSSGDPNAVSSVTGLPIDNQCTTNYYCTYNQGACYMSGNTCRARSSTCSGLNYDSCTSTRGCDWEDPYTAATFDCAPDSNECRRLVCQQYSFPQGCTQWAWEDYCYNTPSPGGPGACRQAYVANPPICYASSSACDARPGRDSCNDLTGCDAKILCYRDADGDGLTAASATSLDWAADCPSGYRRTRSNEPDCDDSNARFTYEDAWFRDADRDRRTNGVHLTTACSPPGNHLDAIKLSEIIQGPYNYQTISGSNYIGDCNDDNANVYEGNGCQNYCPFQEDCIAHFGYSQSECEPPANARIADMEAWCGDQPNCWWTEEPGNTNPKQTYYLDADRDNYNAGSSFSCGRPSYDYVTSTSGGNDCNDGNAAINPAATEICDGIDNNCVSGVDEGMNNYCSSGTGYSCGGASGWISTTCSPYTCGSSACRTSCTQNDHCIANYECAGGACKKSNGQVCSADSECASARCDGTCMARLGNGNICDEDSDCISVDCNPSPNGNSYCTSSNAECATSAGNDLHTSQYTCYSNDQYLCNSENSIGLNDYCTAGCIDDGDGTFSDKQDICTGSLCDAYTPCPTGYACNGPNSPVDGDVCATSCLNDDNDYCVSSFYCYDGDDTCQTGENGARCDDTDADCNVGNYCRNSIDTCVTGATGAGCDDDADCDAGLFCNINNECDWPPTIDSCAVLDQDYATGIGADTIAITCDYTDLDGYADIEYAQILINYQAANDPSCTSGSDIHCGGYPTWTQSTDSWAMASTYNFGSATITSTNADSSCSGNTCSVTYELVYQNTWVYDDHDIAVNIKDLDRATREGWYTIGVDQFNTVECIIDSDCAATHWCDTGNTPANYNTCQPRITCYPDTDVDGYGDPNNPGSFRNYACTEVAGYVADNTDCEDTRAWQRPGLVWYNDNDNDYYIDANTPERTQCVRPPATTDHSEDANQNWWLDGRAATNSNAPNTHKRIFNDRVPENGEDCNDANIWQNPDTVWYDDTDNDGYADGTTYNGGNSQCDRPNANYKGHDATGGNREPSLISLGTDALYDMTGSEPRDCVNANTYTAIVGPNPKTVNANQIYPGASDSGTDRVTNYRDASSASGTNYIRNLCDGIDYDCNGFGFNEHVKDCYADRDNDQWYEANDNYTQCASDFDSPTSCDPGYYNNYHLASDSLGEDCYDGDSVTNYLCCPASQYIHEKRAYTADYTESISTADDWAFDLSSSVKRLIEYEAKGACAANSNYCIAGISYIDNTPLGPTPVGNTIIDPLYGTGEIVVCNDYNNSCDDPYGCGFTDCDNDANACNVYCGFDWVDPSNNHLTVGDYNNIDRAECCGDDSGELTVTQYCEADNSRAPVCCPDDGTDWRILDGACIPVSECPDIMQTAATFIEIADSGLYAATKSTIDSDSDPGTYCCDQGDTTTTGCTGTQGCYVTSDPDPIQGTTHTGYSNPTIEIQDPEYRKEWCSQVVAGDPYCVLDVCEGNYDLCERSYSCQEEMIPLSYDELQGRVACSDVTFTTENQECYPELPASCDASDVTGCEVVIEQSYTCAGGTTAICDNISGTITNCEQVCESPSAPVDIITYRGPNCVYGPGCEPTNDICTTKDIVTLNDPASCTDLTICNEFGCNAVECGPCTASGCFSCGEPDYFLEESTCREELLCETLDCDLSGANSASSNINLACITETTQIGTQLLIRLDENNASMWQCSDVASLDQGDHWCPDNFVYDITNDRCERATDYCDSGYAGNLEVGCNDLFTPADDTWGLYHSGCITATTGAQAPPMPNVYNNVCCLAITVNDFEVYGDGTSFENIKIY